MGEYWVTHKRMKEKGIEQIRAVVKTPVGLANPLVYDRKTLVQSIKNGDIWCTCLPIDEDVWTKKAEIHIVEVEGEEFIRTDEDKIKSDKLDELPDF